MALAPLDEIPEFKRLSDDYRGSPGFDALVFGCNSLTSSLISS
jgi:hypothetical protein